MPRPRSSDRHRPVAGATKADLRHDDRVMVKVQSLGAARLVIGTQVIGGTSGLLLCLMMRLVYAPGFAVARDTLLDELWPDQPVLRQRGNLRQALYKLRTLGVRVALVSGAVRFDRRQLERTFCVERTAEHFERDVTRGSEPFGAFLPGCPAPSAAWQRWVEEVRDIVHGDIRRVLVDQLRMRRERVDWGGAAVLSRWLLQFDPLNEDATLAMAECTMLSGAKAEAVAILDRYLAELGPNAGDIRLPAALLRRRFTEPPVRRRPSMATTERHFVGREQEMADLTRAMRRARWHDGSAVLLHGPPGIGKTRLCTELGKVAQIEGYREVSIECRETDQQRPLAVLVDALPALLASPGALGSAPESLAVLRRLVGDDVREARAEPEAEPAPEPAMEPTLSDVAGPAISAAERYERTMRTVRAQSIRHAIIDLVAAVSDERPVFLVIDDAHWLDDASWEVVSDLTQRVNAMRLFIVLTSRFATVRAERPTRMPANLNIRRVPGLADEDCLRLTRAIGQDLAAHPSAEIEAWLIRGSEGTPLLLRALLDHWIITGDASGIPPTLTSLLEQRLDRLAPTALMALQAITLLGRYASLDRIRATLQLPTHELLQALDQLEDSGCLASTDAALVITHDLVGRTASTRLSSLVEATLRASIAVALEAEYLEVGETSLLLEALQHVEISGRPEALYRFICRHDASLIKCGRPTMVLNATRAILKHGEWLSEDRTITRLQARLESENGSFGTALSLLPEGLSLPQDYRGASSAELDDYLSFVETAYRSNPIANPFELGSFAASIASHSEFEMKSRLRAADIGLIIAANTCDTSSAEACYFGLNLSERDIDRSEETQRIGLLFHSVFGSVDRANALASSIFLRASRSPATTAAIGDCARAGFVFRMTGRHTQAIDSLMRARSMALEIDSPRLAEYPCWQLAQIANEQGDSASASLWTNELLSLTASNHEESEKAYIHGHLCLMAINRGEVEQAAIHLEQLKLSQPSFPHMRSACYCMALELGVSAMDPNWSPTSALVDVAVARFERTCMFAGADVLAATVGESLIRIGRAAHAQALISDYIGAKRRERSNPSAMLARLLKKLESSEQS